MTCGAFTGTIWRQRASASSLGQKRPWSAEIEFGGGAIGAYLDAHAEPVDGLAMLRHGTSRGPLLHELGERRELAVQLHREVAPEAARAAARSQTCVTFRRKPPQKRSGCTLPSR